MKHKEGLLFGAIGISIIVAIVLIEIDILFVLIGTAITSFGILYIGAEFRGAPEHKQNFVLAAGLFSILFGCSLVGLLRTAVNGGSVIPFVALCGASLLIAIPCMLYTKK